MKITVYYASGRIDVHDTEKFTAGEPFKTDERAGVCIDVEYQLRFDRIKEQGLILELFWYDARVDDYTPKTRDEDADIDVYHAVRRQGRFICLVDLKELDQVVKIMFGDEVLAWRQGDELINAVRFSAQELLCFSNDTTTSINSRALAIFAYLQKANPTLSSSEIASMMGYSMDALDAVKGQEDANADLEDEFEGGGEDDFTDMEEI